MPLRQSIIFDTLKYSRNFLNILGVWPMKEPTRTGQIFSKMRAIGIATVLISCLISAAISAYVVERDLVVLCDLLDVSLLFVYALVITLTLHINRRGIEKIIMAIVEMEQSERYRHKEHFILASKIGKIYSIVFEILCSIIGILFAINPMAQLLYSGELTFPVGLIYPFDHYKSPYSIFVFIFEALTVFINVTTISGINSMTVPVLQYVECSFYSLFDEIEELKYDVEMYENEQVGRKSQKQLNKQFQSIIQKHARTLTICHRYIMLIGPCILMDFLMQSLLLCLCFTQLYVAGSQYPLQSFKAVLFIGGAIVDLFTSGFLGTRVAETSKKLSDEAYKTPWYSMDKAFQLKLKFMIQRCGKPLKFERYKFGSQDLASMPFIFKSAWSYFTLFNAHK